jgi:hypothetical protein
VSLRAGEKRRRSNLVIALPCVIASEAKQSRHCERSGAITTVEIATRPSGARNDENKGVIARPNGVRAKQSLLVPPVSLRAKRSNLVIANEVKQSPQLLRGLAMTVLVEIATRPSGARNDENKGVIARPNGVRAKQSLVVLP